MTKGPGAKDAPHPLPDVERDSGHDLFGLEGQDRQAILDWVGEHLAQVRRSVYATSDSCTGAWGSPSWSAWPSMSVAMRCDRR